MNVIDSLLDASLYLSAKDYEEFGNPEYVSVAGISGVAIHTVILYIVKLYYCQVILLSSYTNRLMY